MENWRQGEGSHGHSMVVTTERVNMYEIGKTTAITTSTRKTMVIGTIGFDLICRLKIGKFPLGRSR